jgi:mannose-6-phosphate isomerase-like protein (cupin superfamily)
MAREPTRIDGVPLTRHWLIPQGQRPKVYTPHPTMSGDDIRRGTQRAWNRFYSLPNIRARAHCVESLKSRLAFVLISKLYRQMYANTGIATDSARVGGRRGGRAGSPQMLSAHTTPFDAIAHVLEGEATITIAGTVLALQAGELVLMPANQPHEVVARALVAYQPIEQRYTSALTIVTRSSDAPRRDPARRQRRDDEDDSAPANVTGSSGDRPNDSLRSSRVAAVESSVARQDTKGLPAFDSVHREIHTIRREHGRALELLRQRDQRGICEVHRQIGVLVEQLANTPQ